MKRNAGVFKTGVVFFASFFFLAVQMAYASGPGLNMAGQAQGAGSAEMRTNSGWIGISGKAYPLISGSELVTGKGEISIMLKNGARMEAGKDTELVVSYVKGNYLVLVQRGTIKYDVPQSARLSIATANSKVTVYALSKGFVGVGKDTYVKSIAGNATVNGVNAHGAVAVKAGETIRVAQANGIASFTQVAYDEAAIESAIHADPAMVADASAGTTATDAAVTTGTGAGFSSTTGLIIGSVIVGGAVAGAIAAGSGSSSPN